MKAQGFDKSMCLGGTVVFPARKLDAASGSAPAVAGPPGGADTVLDMGAHEWKANHFPVPFWAVQRRPLVHGTKCELQSIEVATAQTFPLGSSGEPAVQMSSVSLPVLRNTKEIAKGEELVVHWPVREANKSKQAPRSTTWAQQAGQAAKKAKRAA